jgi:excisionase family DNA binding protein
MEQLVDVNEVARLTKISKSTIRRYVLLKQIPFYKVVCAIRFKVSEIEIWLENFKRGDVNTIPHTPLPSQAREAELPFSAESGAGNE